LIGIDQEGGKIERLKSKMGFIHTPSAKELGAKDDINATKQAYDALASELHETGFTLDFAPVVDLDANPNNTVIVGNERAYGKSPEIVTKHAQIFVDSLKSHGIVSVLKHFPGHGSSLGDSHKGFVDSSTTWKPDELKPFVDINTPMIMSAHIFLEQLDDKYPATLSKKILTDKLRGEMGYKGAIISDDMQMGAIDDNFNRKKSIELALNAGIDMLLYANQNGEEVSLKDIIKIVNELVTEGAVKKERIEVAYERIVHLKSEHKLNTSADVNMTTAMLIDTNNISKKKSHSKSLKKKRKVQVRVD
jgi:beta-N-acetylhexosaminidase